ncbi:transglycosylase-like protein with SLT domain [Haloactinospora alba]|uniref:Transglycosylase-like protein with SLT domain n=1 Tax=Haloactinospora alba TaxID=405555 RepID=A0A543NM57_9ACTN|nr:transglycosylase SLT domain-containing protein [Haloactinospora alba]TQN32884.1 transglycosylase-like protein with SLT domain [Haloactinospora alba]
MLLNRISLRVATAVGSAAVVAGATFAVSAFADAGGEPDQAVSAMTPDRAADTGKNFFADVDEPSQEELAEQRDKAEKKLDEASSAALASGAGATTEKEKEEEEEEETDEGDSGGSVPDGSPKEIAQSKLGDYGWGQDQFSCLDALWERESGWDPSAENPSSGAYGIPQALPGNKMASAGSDWKTNPATQIEWGLGYIDDRYESPCDAKSFSDSNGHY